MNPKSPSASNIRLGTAKIASLASLTVPDVSHNAIPQRRFIVQEPNSEFLVQLNQLQQNLQKTVKSLEGQKEVMMERVEFFESYVLKNQELVSGLRSRISQLTCQHHDTAIQSSANKPIQSAAAELTNDTVVDFLQNQPLILSTFLRSSADSTFSDYIQHLPNDTKAKFLDYSSQQLNRFSQCFSLFCELISKSRSSSFLDSLTSEVKKIYQSQTCLIFIKDSKTGRLSCFFDSKEMQISLGSEGTTVISDAIETQKCKTYTDPSSSPFFSPSFDPLFNPENQALILIPISREAVIYVLHTDPHSFCFTEEDCAIGTLLSILIQPLLHDNLNYEMISREVKRREVFASFENEITKIDHFLELIPFLQNSLLDKISALKTRLFIVDEGEVYSYTVNGNQLLKKSSKLCGVIDWIFNNKQYITVDKLNNVTVPSYDQSIDEWAYNIPFAAYPIYGSNDEVTSVVCISGKECSTKFSEWDLEFLLSMTSVLAIIVPKCMENEFKIEEEQVKIDLYQFPVAFNSLTFEEFKKDDYLKTIATKIVEVIKCEWISIFINNNFVLSLHNVSKVEEKEEKTEIIVVDKPIITTSYSSILLLSEATTNSSDVSRIEGFEVIGDISKPSSLLHVYNNGIHVVAINTTTRLGHFAEAHESILKAFESVIIIAQKVHELNCTILSSRLSIESLNKIMEICNVSIKQDKPLISLMKSLCDMINIKEYCFLKRIKLNRTFDPILSSAEINEAEIPESDQFIQKAMEMNSHFVIKKDDLESKICNEMFPESLLFIVSTITKNDFYLVLIGEEFNEDFIPVLMKMSSIIEIYFENYLLASKRELVAITEMNKLDFHHSTVSNNDYLESLSFQSTSLNESQQIEAILKIASNMKLIEFLGIDLFKFSLVLYDIKKEYRDVPYHNFSHALDVTQFVYQCFLKGNEILSYFHEIEITAIFLASLCHDIDHNAIDSATLNRCNSSMSFSFGILSTLERNHAFVSSEILKKSVISKYIDNENFWDFFMNIIFATDIQRSKEFHDKFNNIKNNFDPKDRGHRLLLAQFIVICGNLANCIRPFEFASSMAEAIEQERRIQFDYEKNHSSNHEIETLTTSLAEREIDFLTNVASPLFRTIQNHFTDIGDLGVLIEENRGKWKGYKPHSAVSSPRS